jgi:hypothetical protein
MRERRRRRRSTTAWSKEEAPKDIDPDIPFKDFMQNCKTGVYD